MIPDGVFYLDKNYFWANFYLFIYFDKREL